MELPGPLRQEVERLLAASPGAEIKGAAARLSQRYRQEVRDGRLHIDGDVAARAYLATRLPATYAAIRAALGLIEDVAPDFAPRTQLDVGAGPGSALWAAADCWPALAAATLVEASPAIRQVGETLSRRLDVEVQWLAGDAVRAMPAAAPADLVTLAYVLDEIEDEEIAPLVRRLWNLTDGILVVVEPGTPAGARRILAVRAALLEAGAYPVAPCPHALACPLAAPDWCHFARRVARSRRHRLAKGAEVPWEDEKYAFFAASRRPVSLPDARVLARPDAASGLVRLKLCRSDGEAGLAVTSRRDGALFKAARRADWGDALDRGEG